ncbi:esterase/lipase family protein [Singulisphaera sp. PoT]|uniref:esterase/lipase family protein n=1 Tax=Singulisphaera sp. PoT TaxID=3411797 RepID=UPI003BF528AE
MLLLSATAGCAGVTAREAPLRNKLIDYRERIETGFRLSEASAAVLARNGFYQTFNASPGEMARALEAKLQNKSEPDGALALAELSYQAGLSEGMGMDAIPWYRDAAILGMMALDDPYGTRPDLAIEIHNGALERVLRVARKSEMKRHESQPWRTTLSQLDIAVGSTMNYLDPERLASVQPASDLRVRGMDNIYRSGGLGVPLVAHRVADPNGLIEARDQFMPRETQVGATAVVMPGGGLLQGDWRRNPASMILFDPFRERSMQVSSRDIPLASDRTTPLAVQVDQGYLSTIEWTGLLESSFERPGFETGLYTLHPYERGKIPVVFVHGLVSSPRAFVQNVNELQNAPEIASRYQFWVFMYPTGLPIPSSAAKLREALYNIRETLDPNHTDPALDRMVFVGHSMGGLLSKMMAQDSGLMLWDATIKKPYEKIQNSPTLQKTVGAALVYQAVPSVRRLIFIASPHRGSPIASDLFGRFVSSLVRRNDSELQVQVKEELKAIYGENVIKSDMRRKALNAIGNLRTDSPILQAIHRIPIRSSVPYHSIIPLVNGTLPSDLVVPYYSSHLPGATSEKILSGTHFSQEKPEVTAELRRILLVHLEENRDLVPPPDTAHRLPIDRGLQRANALMPANPEKPLLLRGNTGASNALRPTSLEKPLRLYRDVSGLDDPVDLVLKHE